MNIAVPNLASPADVIAVAGLPSELRLLSGVSAVTLSNTGAGDGSLLADTNLFLKTDSATDANVVTCSPNVSGGGMILRTTSRNTANTGSAKVDVCVTSAGDGFIKLNDATGNQDYDALIAVGGGDPATVGRGQIEMGCSYVKMPALQFTQGNFGAFYMQIVTITSDTDIGINTAVDFTTTFTSAFSTGCTAVIPVNVSTDNNASRLSCSIRAKRAGGFDFSVYSPAVATTVQWSYQFIAYGY